MSDRQDRLDGQDRQVNRGMFSLNNEEPLTPRYKRGGAGIISSEISCEQKIWSMFTGKTKKRKIVVYRGLKHSENLNLFITFAGNY